LDVGSFLRYVAITAVLANYDSFIGNGHNYYLYQPPVPGRAVFIPWDLNEAFGGHPMAGTRREQAELSVLHPQAGSNRLIDRVLANPRWAAAYRKVLGDLLVNACEPTRLKETADVLARLLQPAVSEESISAKAMFQKIALGQSVSPVPPSRSGPPGPPEDMPLANWITLRLQNVSAELAGQRTAKAPSMSNFPGPGGLRGWMPGWLRGPGERPEPKGPPRP
jgi:hypothetical protein